MSDPSPDAKAAADRLIAERGPLPDHLVRSIAKRMTKALTDQSQTERKPA